ncbi:MAG: hypothetical protein ATN35_01805 [Epulopiscium sp. Nele67-Bin004]|nr:MAG: hypothetical protein ATN35_01805 [Epulopiscium sp. Nele67-Bin004]
MVKLDKIYKNILQKQSVDGATKQALFIIYDEMGEKGVQRFLGHIGRYLKTVPLVQVHLCSYFYYKKPNKEYFEFILNLIRDNKLDFMMSHNLYKQISRISELNDQPLLTDYKDKYFVWKYIYEKFSHEINTRKYKTYNQKSNIVVVATGQLLEETHAPTAITIQKCRQFLSLGKEVVLVVTGDVLLTENVFIGCLQGRYTAPHIGMGELDLGDNLSITYYHPALENYTLDTMKIILNYIYGLKPELVYQIGGGSVIIDACNLFTKVATQSLSMDIPVAMSRIIVPVRRLDEEEMCFLNKHEHEFITLEMAKHYVQPLENIQLPRFEDIKTKEEFEIDKSKFVMAIVGNRLDIELKSYYLELLERIIKIDSSVYIVFIGTFDYEGLFANRPIILKNSIHLGYQENLKSTLTMCDLFLNPPRKGGGIGALWAIQVDVPVVTFGNCDVALNVGENFICEDNEEYFQTIKKYVIDKEFYKLKQQQCKELIYLHRLYNPREVFRAFVELIEKL